MSPRSDGQLSCLSSEQHQSHAVALKLLTGFERGGSHARGNRHVTVVCKARVATRLLQSITPSTELCFEGVNTISRITANEVSSARRIVELCSNAATMDRTFSTANDGVEIFRQTVFGQIAGIF